MLTNIKIMKRSIITKQLAAILSCRGLLLNAYVIPTNRMISTNRAFSNTRVITIQRPLIQSNTRLYSSLFNNNNNNKKEGFLTKLADKAKSLVPKSWLSKEDQKKQAAIERKKEMKNELSNNNTTSSHTIQ